MQGVSCALGDEGFSAVFCHLNSGQRIFLDPRDPDIFCHTLEHGDWEDHLETIFQNSLRDVSSCFIDVGASIGIHSLRAARYTKNIFAIEPDPISIKFLQTNLEINGIYSAKTLQLACGSKKAKVKLNKSKISSGRNYTTRANKISLSKNITQITIDELSARENLNPTLIKIDVEGNESNVVIGAKKTIEKNLPNIIAEAYNSLNLEKIIFAFGELITFYDILIYAWPNGAIDNVDYDFASKKLNIDPLAKFNDVLFLKRNL